MNCLGEMMKKQLLIFIILVIISTSLTSATSFDIVRPDKNSWVCVDYAVSYTRDNPEYGIVTISTHPYFRGVSHMVNYKIDQANKTLIIHDDMLSVDFNVSYDSDIIGLPYVGYTECAYFHFWLSDEQIKRNYILLKDNREEVLNG